MNIEKEVSPGKSLYNGHTTVGLTAVPLANKFPTTRGILLRCPGSLDPTPNTACVWVGGKGVTADSAATGGMPIAPGSHLVLPVDDASAIYVISTAADQDVAWMGV